MHYIYADLAIVLIMGLRHGFDLDHLATIDAITRTIHSDASLSKFTGVLFSLGHGLVITLLSVIVGGGIIRFKISNSFEIFGNCVSILFLILFGLLNFMTIFKISERFSKKINIKQFLLNYIVGKNYNPVAIFCIGALFAISFDTFSQIALLSLSAAALGGFIFSFFIGILFTLGIILADGLNGLFIFNIISMADKCSTVVSRTLGLGIAFFSLAIGVNGIMSFIT